MENDDNNPVFPIDLSIFKDQIRQSLLNILDTLPKVEKTLVVEKSCISKMNYFTTLEPLKERQIKKELVILKPSTFISDSPIVIYMISPTIENVKIIEKHIEINSKEIQDQNLILNKFHIIFIPKIESDCLSFIKSSNYKNYIHFHVLNIDTFTLDYDLFSLEEKNAFRDIYVSKNMNCLSELSRAIIKYETVFGKIKYKYSKGAISKKLTDILNKEEEASISTINNENETLACFIFDRSVDMVTPFCTSQIYEGVLNDYIGIDFNSVKITPKILEKESKSDVIKLDLSTNDKFYTLIKDYNIEKVKSYLPECLRESNQQSEEKDKKEKISLSNHLKLTDFVTQKMKFPIYKFYQNFEKNLLKGELPNKLHDFYEDEIGKKSDEYNLLKLICLESVINSGIRFKIYEQMKKDFLTTYGYQHIFLFYNLEKIDVLKPQDNSYFYTEANKKLNLIFDNVDLNEPNDTSYVYSGYSPITIRLIEKAITQGWLTIKDLLKKIPGDTDFPADESEIFGASLNKQFILLVYIGGITFGELAAVRYLNKKNRNKKFIVLTTGMINYKNIFDALKEGEYFLKDNKGQETKN